MTKYNDFLCVWPGYKLKYMYIMINKTDPLYIIFIILYLVCLSLFFSLVVYCCHFPGYSPSASALYLLKRTRYKKLKIVLFPDFVWRVCGKFQILVILYWFGGKLIKNKRLRQSCKDIYLDQERWEFGQNWQLFD